MIKKTVKGFFAFIGMIGIISCLPILALAYDPVLSSVSYGSTSHNLSSPWVYDLSSVTGLAGKTVTAISLQVYYNAPVTFTLSGTCTGYSSANFAGNEDGYNEITSAVDLTFPSNMTGCTLTIGTTGTQFAHYGYIMYGITTPSPTPSPSTSPTPSPSTGGSSTLSSDIDNASSTMAAAVGGISPSDTASWMSSNVISLVIGSALGFLLLIWPYILTLIIIGAVIYFAYRGFIYMRS